MFPLEVAKIITEYADDIVLKQIKKKCKLLRHIEEGVGPIIHCMNFRKRMFPQRYIQLLVWQQGIDICQAPYFVSFKTHTRDVKNHRNVPLPI